MMGITSSPFNGSSYTLFADVVEDAFKMFQDSRSDLHIQLARRRLESGQCRSHPEMDPIVSLKH